MNDPFEIQCTHCKKMFAFEPPEGSTKFGSDAVTCPHCNQPTFVEMTTEIDPDAKRSGP